MTRSIRLPHKVVLAVLITLCAGLVLAGCSGTKDAVDQTAGGQYKYVGATPRGKTIAEAKRKVAGPAKGSLLDGSAWNLRALKGQVVVVNYWGTWCAPCRIETPNFQRVYQQFKAQGVTFVGVDVKETSSSPAKAFVKDNAITFPIVYDAGAKTALQIGHLPLQGLPNTVVIDKQGKVAAVYVGSVQPGDLEPVLTSLAAEH
ncbi:MAG: TlpA family protein disulfide reductase [Jatrophihabitans sp.]